MGSLIFNKTQQNKLAPLAFYRNNSSKLQSAAAKLIIEEISVNKVYYECESLTKCHVMILKPTDTDKKLNLFYCRSDLTHELL